jgi:L-lactate dehydrogenase complex protein LldG
VSSYDEIINILLSVNGENKKIISTVTELTAYYSEEFLTNPQISNIHDIDVTVLKGRFGIAENGAVWLTDQEMRQRALPFICQHLAVILNADNIIPTMHEAYELISKITYDFATFIAGPSKTADIEQSLVIGAHGPRSMTVFVMSNNQ